MYYTDPYGLPEIRQRLAALHQQFAAVPGVEGPDKFAQAFYDAHYAWAQSPYTEGSSFGHIEAEITQRYLNQPAIVAARGASVDIFADPAVQSTLAQSAAAANARWQATQQDDSFFGDLFNVASAALSWITQGPSPGSFAATFKAASSLGGGDAPNIPGVAAAPIVGRAAQLSGTPPKQVDPLGAFFRLRWA